MFRQKAVVRIRMDIRNRLNYMEPHPLAGIHAITAVRQGETHPVGAISRHWPEAAIHPI